MLSKKYRYARMCMALDRNTRPDLRLPADIRKKLRPLIDSRLCYDLKERCLLRVFTQEIYIRHCLNDPHLPLSKERVGRHTRWLTARLKYECKHGYWATHERPEE